MGAPVDRMPSSSISIHALLAESDDVSGVQGYRTLISIHALLAESDVPSASRSNIPAFNFYPRSPCGERQSPKCVLPWTTSNFYPRSPCGERRGIIRRNFVGRRFLSTLSLRRATVLFNPYQYIVSYFYPRSPCGERPYGRINDISRLIFLSTLSLRRATALKTIKALFDTISIHALLAESDHTDVSTIFRG